MIDSESVQLSVTGGSGEGELTLASSDPEVATVNNDLSINIHGAGHTTITATKSSDGQYQQASSTMEIAISLYDQETIEFDQLRLKESVLKSQVENSFIGGSGSGDLSWTISDPSVADIQDGEIFLKHPGVATITVTKASDGYYHPTSANFTLEVVAAPEHFTANLGLEQTSITVENAHGITDIYRHLSPTCDIANYASCTFGERYITHSESTVEIEDSEITSTLSGWLTFAYEDTVSEPVHIKSTAPQFSGRRHNQAFSFNDELFVVGGLRYDGEDGQDRYLGDIWVTDNGASWTEATEQAAFAGRDSHRVIEFKGRLFLLGGWIKSPYGGGTQTIHDAWMSFDGVEWEELAVIGEPGFSDGFDVAVFNNRIWATGTYYHSEGYHTSTISSSPDGVRWQYHTTDADFPPLERHQLVAFQDKLWLIGGSVAWSEEDSGPSSQIWSSVDGDNWILEQETAAFGVRAGHKVIEFNNQLWLIGGYNNQYDEDLIDVWVSDNGVDWERTGRLDFLFDSYAPTLAVHKEELWIVGGLHTPNLVWRYHPEHGWRTPATFEINWPSME